MEEQLKELSRSNWRSLSRLLLLLLTGRSIRRETADSSPYLEKLTDNGDNMVGGKGREGGLLSFCVKKICELFAEQLAIDFLNSQKILLSLEKTCESEEKRDADRLGGSIDANLHWKESREDERVRDMIQSIRDSYSSYVEIRLNLIEQVFISLAFYHSHFSLSLSLSPEWERLCL